MVTVPAYIALRNTSDRRGVRTAVVVDGGSNGDVTIVVDVDGQGGRYTVPFLGQARGTTRPSVGDLAVLVPDAGRLVCIGTIDTTVAVPPLPDPEDPDTNPPPPEPDTTKVTLRPKATGTARNGSVRPDTGDLYQGDWTGRGVNSGMAVYAAKSLSGTVKKATLRIKRLDAGVYAAASPTLRLMNQSSLVGNPTWQDSQVGPAMKVGETRTVSLPTSWGQKLVNGQAGGIGIHVSGSSPYIRLAGKAAGLMTLTLTIEE